MTPSTKMTRINTAGTKRRAVLWLAAVGAVLLSPLYGCYERTVRTSGFGADTSTTYEPNLKTDTKTKAESSSKGKFRWEK